ncbi:SDR family NAD(P)-dependent oxidoreductase [Aeromicrobium sp. Root495]|uniref:SDR family NAD(P)-dependent oxidoreductase n=1 Tax=Aeromicrobium sp. Root495 TaxID=1736550 RepID=UPI000AB065DE|nr:SDR family oxidoreductase [Aeromicrobium sp. Root495]RYJ05981.1 MAG: SDR family oxidoreductase [Actinomycetales bacterium]
MTSEPKVVLVTGASSGIGRAAVVQAAAAGHHVVLVARGRNALESAADEARAAGAASVLVVPADVGSDAEVASCFAEVSTRHGGLDAVIHAAGVVAYGRTEEVPPDVFEGVLRTNVVGSVNVSRHAVRWFREQEHGTLVLIGSVIGHIAVPTMSPYVVSKWGVRALARQLQIENRDLRHVHVSYVAPGGVDTPIYQQAATYDGFLGRPPPPVDSPEKVAGAALRQLRHSRKRTQVGLANGVMRFGFSAMPGVFDVLVGPLFRLAALDGTRPVEPTPGNVLESQESRNALRGTASGLVRGVAANVKAGLSGSRSSR